MYILNNKLSNKEIANKLDKKFSPVDIYLMPTENLVEFYGIQSEYVQHLLKQKIIIRSSTSNNEDTSKTNTHPIEKRHNLLARYQNLPSEIKVDDLDISYQIKVEALRNLYKDKNFDFIAYINPIRLAIEIIPVTNIIRIINYPFDVGLIDIQIKDNEELISVLESDILYIPKSFQIMFDLGLELVAINVGINKMEKALE